MKYSPHVWIVPTSCQLFLLAVLFSPAIGHAAIKESDQYSGTSETVFDVNISSTDLINKNNPLRTDAVYTGSTTGGAFSGLTDGAAKAGTIENDVYFNPANLGASTPDSATYTLDTKLNPLGYDITEIRTFNGWRDSNGYSNQSYKVEVSLIGSPTFVELKTVNFSPFRPGAFASGTGPNCSQVTLTDSTGRLATGVDQIRFTWIYKNSVSSPDGQVVREVDLLGVAITAAR
jgi:hypothetical protein